MALTLATSDDVRKKWRPLSSSEAEQVAALLEEASALLRRKVANLDDRIGTAELDAVLVRRVVTNAVLRVLRNPSGVTQQSAGPETASWSGIRATGEVTITDADVADILPTDTGTIGGTVIGTIHVVAPALAACAAPYGSPAWGADPVPLLPSPLAACGGTCGGYCACGGVAR